MNNGVLIGIVIAVIVVIAGYFLFFNTSTSDIAVSPLPSVGVSTLEEEIAASPTPSTTSLTSPSSSAAAPAAGAVKEFTVTGSNFAFDVKEMRVKQGDTVRVTLKSGTGFHDWKLDEFNAATKTLATGQSETVEFVASKTGQFEYYCSVANHRAMGMVGKLIVE